MECICQQRAKISEAFKKAIRDFPGTVKALSEETGVNASRISRIMNDVEIPKISDKQLKKIAEYIKFDGQCFEEQ